MEDHTEEAKVEEEAARLPVIIFNIIKIWFKNIPELEYRFKLPSGPVLSQISVFVSFSVSRLSILRCFYSVALSLCGHIGSVVVFACDGH